MAKRIGIQDPGDDPTPEEIALLAAEIRARWSEEEHLYRFFSPHLERSWAEIFDGLAWRPPGVPRGAVSRDEENGAKG